MPERALRSPFFEIGPKGYLYGRDALELAEAVDIFSAEFDVAVVFTPQFTDIYPIAHGTKYLLVCTPHMDFRPPGRGQGSVLPEAVKAAGAAGAMFNHAERPLTFQAIKGGVERAREVGLFSIVCADSIAEIRASAFLRPDVVVAEPTELIGTGRSSDTAYVAASIAAVREISPDTMVLCAAGISTGDDVYEVIMAGADATGSSSAICKSPDPIKTAREMIMAVRAASDDRLGRGAR